MIFEEAIKQKKFGDNCAIEATFCKKSIVWIDEKLKIAQEEKNRLIASIVKRYERYQNNKSLQELFSGYKEELDLTMKKYLKA